jgi:hypothetical protein
VCEKPATARRLPPGFDDLPHVKTNEPCGRGFKETSQEPIIFDPDEIPANEWSAGSLAVANLKVRVGWMQGPEGGGRWTFFYRGGTDHLQETLKAFSVITADRLEVVLHDGRGTIHFLQGDGFNWSFEVWVRENWERLFNNPGNRATSLSRITPTLASPSPPRGWMFGCGRLDRTGRKSKSRRTWSFRTSAPPAMITGWPTMKVLRGIHATLASNE